MKFFLKGWGLGGQSGTEVDLSFVLLEVNQRELWRAANKLALLPVLQCACWYYKVSNN